MLLFIGWSFFDSNYREPQRALDEGVQGAFTVTDCTKGKRGKTYCNGSFRSDDGRVVEEDVALPNKHDASGLKNGESFPARLRVKKDGESGPPLFARSDGEGRSNITEKGISAAGLGVIGVGLVGFAGRGAALRRDSGAWRPLGILLGLTVSAGIAIYVIWSVMGGGFLA